MHRTEVAVGDREHGARKEHGYAYLYYYKNRPPWICVSGLKLSRKKKRFRRGYGDKIVRDLTNARDLDGRALTYGNS